MNREEAERYVDWRMREMEASGDLEGCRDQGDLREAMIRNLLENQPPETVWKVIDRDGAEEDALYLKAISKSEVRRRLSQKGLLRMGATIKPIEFLE